MLTRNRLYGLILTLAAASYGLLGYLHFGGSGGPSAELCPINRVTGIPCPSCGTARSVIQITEGSMLGALWTNPLGFLAATMLVIIPLWAAYDLVRGHDTLYRRFRKGEELLVRSRWLAFLLVLLILANWGWNIAKGL
ncbi:MAG: DUF2752 domain-containing protein [Cyclonatronaceae bacterium]